MNAQHPIKILLGTLSAAWLIFLFAYLLNYTLSGQDRYEFIPDIIPHFYLTTTTQTQQENHFYSFQLGIIFKYDPNLYRVIPDREPGTLMVVSTDSMADGDVNAVIISTADDHIPALTWLKSPNSGLGQSETFQHRDLDGQIAYFVDGQQWAVVDAPDGSLRYSIASLGDNTKTQDAFDTITRSLFFIRCPQDYLNPEHKEEELELFLRDMGLNDDSPGEAILEARMHFYKEYECFESSERLEKYLDEIVLPPPVEI